MPLIEGKSGEVVSIGRLQIEYINKQSQLFEVDSEPVVSDDYDIAVYIETLRDEKGNKILEKEKINAILYKISKLAQTLEIRMNFYYDGGARLIPQKFDWSFEDISIVKKKLYESIDTNNHENFEKIILNNPELMNKESYGINQESLLHYCAERNNLESLKILIEIFKENVNKKGHENETPLVRAANRGNLDICKYLHENGAFINGSLNGTTSPLLEACAMGHLKVAKFLVDKGADINRAHKRLNQTPLDVAHFLNQKEIVSYLQELKAKRLT